LAMMLLMKTIFGEYPNYEEASSQIETAIDS